MVNDDYIRRPSKRGYICISVIIITYKREYIINVQAVRVTKLRISVIVRYEKLKSSQQAER